MSAASSSDFTRTVTVNAPATRVFDAIATLDGLRAWWTPLASGSDAPGHTVRLAFEGMDEHIDLFVAAARPPSTVEWRVVEHSALDEWNGTTIRFMVTRAGEASSVVELRHEGLTPKLACYEDCEAGWDFFLASLVALAEHGRGTPFRGRRARR